MNEPHRPTGTECTYSPGRCDRLLVSLVVLRFSFSLSLSLFGAGICHGRSKCSMWNQRARLTKRTVKKVPRFLLQVTSKNIVGAEDCHRSVAFTVGRRSRGLEALHRVERKNGHIHNMFAPSNESCEHLHQRDVFAGTFFQCKVAKRWRSTKRTHVPGSSASRSAHSE